MIFYEYPKCSTCIKAKNYLLNNNIKFIDKNITTETPKKNDLQLYVNKFNIPIKKLFNTSGLKYKELNLKEKLLSMNDEEKFELLSSNGMLIKRPLLIADDFILIGFKENEWDTKLKNEKND